MSIAETIVFLVTLYVYIGIFFALTFLVFGIGLVDKSVHKQYLFRILLIPGMIGLWPLVFWLSYQKLKKVQQ